MFAWSLIRPISLLLSSRVYVYQTSADNHVEALGFRDRCTTASELRDRSTEMDAANQKTNYRLWSFHEISEQWANLEKSKDKYSCAFI